MWKQDIEETQTRYRSRWYEYGYDPRTLGWNKRCQWVRFQAAVELLQESDYSSVLDIGCGFGDLYAYLRHHGWNGTYTGVDIVPELIEEATRRYGGHGASFACTDIMSSPPTGPFDAAVAIGVFNHRVHQGNMAFVSDMIKAMRGCSTKVVVCDFLSILSQVERRQEHLFYAEPSQIFDLASQFSRRVVIHHGYMPFEFQLKLWHDDSFQVAAPVFPSYAEIASVWGAEAIDHDS